MECREFSVDLCVHGMLKGNKLGTSFSKDGYNNLVSDLRKELEKILFKQIKYK